MMKQSRAVSVAVVAASTATLLVLSLTGVGMAKSAVDAPVATAVAPVPVTVSMPVYSVPTPGRTGTNGIIRMRVGDGPLIKVMVDTGTVGLRLWGRVPEGAQISDQSITTRLDGKSVRGAIGSASMNFSGVTTTENVPFQYINTTSGYINRWKRLGVSGIIGLGVGAGDLTNPLMSLPGVLSESWSLNFKRRGTAGSLILGASAPLDATMNFDLPSQGRNRFGHLIWDDHSANGCWSVAYRPALCVPTWFDSGFTRMRVTGKEFNRLPVTASGRLDNKTSVRLAVETSSFFGYRVKAGNKASRNLVKVIPRGRSVINTGNAVYFAFTVTYATATGNIYLSSNTD